MCDFKYLIGVCIFVFGATLFFLKQAFKLDHKAIAAVLIIISLLSLASYTRFGEFHQLPKWGAQNYHPEEVFGYYIGSKYFKETGYSNSYNCTELAIEEIKKENPRQAVPQTYPIADLNDEVTSFTPEDVWNQFRPICHQHFSPQRWESFKNDLSVLFNIGTYDFWWRTNLSDAGYNSTPIFASLAGPAANALPLAPLWKKIGFIDYILLAIAAIFIYRSFGLYPLFGFCLVFGANIFGNQGWTGGSFFRYAWFTALTIALCFLKERKYFWSGVVFAYAAGDRIFPFLFFMGALVPLFFEWRISKGKKTEIFEMINGFLISGFTLVVISILLYGAYCWVDFFAKMNIFTKVSYVNHIGIKKILGYYQGVYPQNFGWDRHNFYQWYTHVAQVVDSRKWIYYLSLFFFTAGSVWACRKKSPEAAALIIGGSLLFVLFVTAQYYYVFFALFPVIMYKSSPTPADNMKMGLLLILILDILWNVLIPPSDILLYIYHSWAIGTFYVLMILIGLWEDRRI